MKFLILCSIVLFSVHSFSAVSEFTTELESDTPYTLEPGITFSSINGGSRFISVGITARLASWLRIGVEGDLPADFDEDAQIYMTRIFSRFPLLDRVNKVDLQFAVMGGLFSTPLLGNEAFAGIEGMVSYSRKLNSAWTVGGRVGMQAAGFNYNNYGDGEFYASSGRIYNRATVFGSYLF